MKPLQIISLVARNIVPLFGVIFLGWSAPNIVILYSLDSALGLASVVMLGAAYETAQEYGTGVRVINGALGWLATFCGVFLLGAIFAVAFSIPAYIFVAGFGWSLTDALNDSAFVRGLWLQAAFSMTGFVETYFTMFRYDNVKPVLKARTGFTIVRWVITMAMSATALSFLGWLDTETGAKVIGIVIMLIYIGFTLYAELYPGKMRAWLESMAPKEKQAKHKAGRKQKTKPAETPVSHVSAETSVKSRDTRPMLMMLVVVVGTFFVLVGGTRIWDEMNLDRNGVRASAHVVNYIVGENDVTADLEIDTPGAAPAAVHIAKASAWHPWERGLALNLICEQATPRVCEIDGWRDRWLVPVVSLMAGLLLLGWSGKRYLRRQSG